MASFLSGRFLVHIPCWLHLYLGCFFYTSRARFICMWGVSLTHPLQASLLTEEFLLHIPCWLHFYLGSLASASLCCSHFYLGSFSCTSRAGFNFICGVSLIDPVLALILCVEFLLHIQCWRHFYLGSFSYTSRAGVNFISGRFS